MLVGGELFGAEFLGRGEGVGDWDFRTADVERMHRLVATDGVLLGVVEKDGGVGVNGDDAGIGERVACDLAGFYGVALLGN